MSSAFRAARWCIAIFLLGPAAWSLLGQTQPLVAARKSRFYLQTSASSVEANGGGIRFDLQPAIRIDPSVEVQIAPPGGRPSVRLISTADGTFIFSRNFDVWSELEAAFPDGIYTLTVGGRVASTFTIRADGFSVPPILITNFDALQAWPSSRADFRWQSGSSFSDRGQWEIAVEDAKDNLLSGPDLITNNGRLTSFTTSTLPFSTELRAFVGFTSALAVAGVDGAPNVIVGRRFLLAFPIQLHTASPVITDQSPSQVVALGSRATFSMSGTSLEPWSYQWFKNDVVIPGATGSSFTLASARLSDAGQYHAEFRGPGGVTRSEKAELLLSPRIVASGFAGASLLTGSEDGQGSNARFDAPTGVAVDAAGVVYVADGNRKTIRRIATDGTVSTLAGAAGSGGTADGVGAAARFFRPVAVAVDDVGNVYVADVEAHTIRKITAGGLVSTLAGTSGLRGFRDGLGSAANFASPSGVAVGRDGRIYVADTGNSRIRAITPAGLVTTLTAGGTGFVDGPAAQSQFWNPTAIAVGPDGTLYISDQNRAAIRTLSPAGVVSTLLCGSLIGGENSKRIMGLAVDRSGTVFATDESRGVVRITASGSEAVLSNVSSFQGIPGLPPSFLTNPVSIACDAAGVLYLGDSQSKLIMKAVVESGTSNPRIETTAASQLHVLAENDSAILDLAVSGPSLFFQWHRNGALIPGATHRTYFLRAGTAINSGRYSLTASNGIGAVTTETVELSFGPTGNVGRLANLSVRSRAGAAAQTLIVGMAISGTGTGSDKPLLIRGIGPGLAEFGVPDVLADPALAIYRESQVLVSNDDWGGTSGLRAAFSAVGAFNLPPASRDAAVGQAFAPGTYTVQLTGMGGATGVALAEIYEAVPGPMAPGHFRLTNLSARTQAGQGADTLIAGLVVGGSTSKTFLIRAVGPGLTPFGVTGVLADPRLVLFRGGTIVGTNDSWRSGSTALPTVFDAVGAFPIRDQDAALLVTLSPGAYTVQVSGGTSGSGIALIEVYEVP